MHGPDHYREAEELLVEANQFTGDDQRRMACLAEAQVHATLALTAATALGSLRVDDHGMPAVDCNAWIVATSADETLVELAGSTAAKEAAKVDPDRVRTLISP